MPSAAPSPAVDETRDGLQAATFRLEREWFGIDVLKVQEVMNPMPVTPVPLAPDYIIGLINVRGIIVSSISLKRRLGFSDDRYDEDHHNIIVNTPRGAVCLCVDEIGDVIPVDALSVSERPSTITSAAASFVRGVIKLDGRLITFLDVALLAGV